MRDAKCKVQIVLHPSTFERRPSSSRRMRRSQGNGFGFGFGLEIGFRPILWVFVAVTLLGGKHTGIGTCRYSLTISTATAFSIGYNAKIGSASAAGSGRADFDFADYAEARLVRSQQGHEAAQSLYQELLRIHPSDKTAASYIAASPDTPARHDASCRNSDETFMLIQKLRTILDNQNYTNAAVQVLLNVPPKLRYASGPVYVTPLSAGSSTAQSPPTPQTGLETLVALFLLGVTQPKHLVDTHLGPTFIPLLRDLGLAFVDRDYDAATPSHADELLEHDIDAHGVVVPYVHLFPLALTTSLRQGHEQVHNLIIATDLHPRILSSTTVGSKQHPAVMYIGPDSLALVQHYTNCFVNNSNKNQLGGGKQFDTIMDVCTGSGIQALSVVVPCRTAICVDLNPRALEFVQFNAALNGRRDNVRCILGDVVTGECQQVHPQSQSRADPCAPDQDQHDDSSSLQLLLQDESVDLLLANPPFIPVPPNDDGISHRYGMFSSGGPDGLVVVRGILQLATRVLKDGATLAMVSEFGNPSVLTTTTTTLLFGNDDDDDDDDACNKTTSRRTATTTMAGLLCTNELPMSAERYAARRADSDDEFQVWNDHLDRIGILDISPGLLYLRKGSKDGGGGGGGDGGDINNGIQHWLVPKTEQGSIWTPSNEDAVEFTSRAWSTIINSAD